MSRKFLTALDLSKNELQNAAVQNLASAPAAPVKGQLYFNTTAGDNTLYWWDGTQWVAAKDAGGSGFPGYAPGGSTTAETTFGLAKADGVATTVARADHTHGSPLHDDAAHSAVHLNALAVPNNTVNMGGFNVSNVNNPVNPSDAATKNYVDNLITGISWKTSVRAATTAQVTMSGQAQTVDGILLGTIGMRVLVKNQTLPAENGIYTITPGAWARTPDADTWNELVSAAIYVDAGTVNGDTAWVCTNDQGGTLGTTGVTFAQFAGGGTVTAGAGMTQAGNVLNVIAADTSLTVAADSVAVNTAVIATVASVTAAAANKADKTTTILGQSPIAGGGDLSGNRVISITNFAGSAAGAVPPSSGGTTTYLRADGTWAAPPAGEIVTGGAGLVKTGTTLDVVGDTTMTVTADSLGVADQGVTNTKLALMPGLTLKGNYQSSPQAPADLTAATLANSLGLARKYFVPCTAGTSTVVTHSFNTQALSITVHRAVAPFDEVEVDAEHTSATTATVRFAAAVAAGDYIITVIG